MKTAAERLEETRQALSSPDLTGEAVARLRAREALLAERSAVEEAWGSKARLASSISRRMKRKGSVVDRINDSYGRGGKWVMQSGGHIHLGNTRIGSVQQVGNKFNAHALGGMRIGEFGTQQEAGDAVLAHHLG